MPSSDESRKTRREARESDVNTLRDDVIIELEDFFDGSTPVAVKKQVGEQLMSIMTGVTIHGFANPSALVHRPVATLTTGASVASVPNVPSVTAPSGPSVPGEHSEVIETLEAIANGYGMSVERLFALWKDPMLQLQRVPAPKRNHVAAVVDAILSHPDLVKDDEAKLKTDDELAALRQLVKAKDDSIREIGAELRLEPDERGDVNAIKDEIRQTRGSAQTISRLKSTLGDPDDLVKAAKELKSSTEKTQALLERVKQAVHGRRLAGRKVRLIQLEELSDEDKEALGF